MEKSIIIEIVKEVSEHDFMELGEERISDLIDRINEGHSIDTLLEREEGRVGRDFDLQISFEIVVEILTIIKTLHQIYRDYRKGQIEEKVLKQKIEETLTKNTKRLSTKEKEKIVSKIEKIENEK